MTVIQNGQPVLSLLFSRNDRHNCWSTHWIIYTNIYRYELPVIYSIKHLDILLRLKMPFLTLTATLSSHTCDVFCNKFLKVDVLNTGMTLLKCDVLSTGMKNILVLDVSL